MGLPIAGATLWKCSPASIGIQDQNSFVPSALNRESWIGNILPGLTDRTKSTVSDNLLHGDDMGTARTSMSGGM
jgi:hypothetical protein